MPPNILATNDDGYRSEGLRSLVKYLKEFSNVIVVAPDGPRSASGLSLTFFRPLRIREYVFDGVKYYAVNGTPGDSVTIGIFHVFNGKNLDMVVSGVNIGENVSLLEFFMSGTIATALFAAIHGIPSIAFSKYVGDIDMISPDYGSIDMVEAGRVSSIITRYFLSNGFPEDIDMLSVNLPDKIREGIRVKVTAPARRAISSKIYVRRDPRGRPYYWIWGDKLKRFRRGSDAHEVLVKGNISITPITINGITPQYSVRRLTRDIDYLDEEISSLMGG